MSQITISKLLNDKNIQAIIYDMDGLLIDSEPLWQQAEMQVFSTVGLHLTVEDCLRTTGMPTRDVINYWFKLSPWLGKSKEYIEDELYIEVISLIKEYGQPMPGVLDSLAAFSGIGLKIGLASASPVKIIETSLATCQVMSYFDFYHSGTLEEENKPNPALYHTVAKNLGVDIENCIILEDSCNGVKGALASGAQVIAVPSPHDYDKACFKGVGLKIPSLVDLIV